MNDFVCNKNKCGRLNEWVQSEVPSGSGLSAANWLRRCDVLAQPGSGELHSITS